MITPRIVICSWNIGGVNSPSSDDVLSLRGRGVLLDVSATCFGGGRWWGEGEVHLVWMQATTTDVLGGWLGTSRTNGYWDSSPSTSTRPSRTGVPRGHLAGCRCAV